MVESGQIQLANHTWSHPDLMTLGANDITDQIRRNDEFLLNTYGVDGRPYLRPPYGRPNALSDRIALDLSYQTTTLWTSSSEDYQPLDQSDLIARAERGFRP
jgi:peptidoglycan/xylan/chitin deacetylase (PgdA/CDA1 family)